MGRASFIQDAMSFQSRNRNFCLTSTQLGETWRTLLLRLDYLLEGVEKIQNDIKIQWDIYCVCGDVASFSREVGAAFSASLAYTFEATSFPFLLCNPLGTVFFLQPFVDIEFQCGIFRTMLRSPTSCWTVTWYTSPTTFLFVCDPETLPLFLADWKFQRWI